MQWWIRLVGAGLVRWSFVLIRHRIGQYLLLAVVFCVIAVQALADAANGRPPLPRYIGYLERGRGED